MADGESSGSSALLGVILGVIVVGVVLFFVFGGFDIFSGGDGDIDVNVDLPAVDVR